MVKQGVKSASEKVSNVAKKTVDKAKKFVEKPKNMLKNQGLKAKNSFQRKSLKNSEKQLEALRKQPHPDPKAIKALEKTIRDAKKSINKTNTRLGLDNRGIARQKAWKDKITNTKESIKKTKDAIRNETNAKNIKAFEEQLAKQKKLLNLQKNKLKGTNIKLGPKKIPSTVLRPSLAPNLAKKGVVMKSLDALVKSPKRLPTIKNLLQLKKGFTTLKRLKNQLSGLNTKLNKLQKNGKTALENARKYPNLAQNQAILALEKQSNTIVKAIDQVANVQLKQLGASVSRGLLELGIFGTITTNALDEQLVYELSSYLQEDNDQFREENLQQKVELGGSNINLEGQASYLGSLTEAELSAVKIDILGKASKSGSFEFNKRLALQRAENAKSQLIDQYPSLDPNNISIRTIVQDSDSTDELHSRQGVDINFQIGDLTYVDGYVPQAEV